MARAYYPTDEGEYTVWTPDMVGAAAENHTHTYLSSLDTRSDNPLPGQITMPDVKDKIGTRFDFKENNHINLQNSGQYSQLITIVPWRDNSGGNIHQWALGISSDLHPKISLRSGNQDTNTWGNWYEFYTSDRPEIVVSSSQPSNSNAKIWIKA